MIELIHQGKGISPRGCMQAECERRIARTCRGSEQPGAADSIKGHGIGDGHSGTFQAQCCEAVSGQRVVQGLVRTGLEQGADIAAGQHDFPGHVPGTTGDTIAGASVSRAFHHTVFVHRAGELIDRGDWRVVVHRDHQAVGSGRYRIAVKVSGIDCSA